VGIKQHRDPVSLEVVTQLHGGDEDCIQQLVDLQVHGPHLVEDLADVVHQTLDDPDHPKGVRCIYFHWSGRRE
jgi:hypothetical protein